MIPPMLALLAASRAASRAADRAASSHIPAGRGKHKQRPLFL